VNGVKQAGVASGAAPSQNKSEEKSTGLTLGRYKGKGDKAKAAEAKARGADLCAGAKVH
jgi:hypothetical protein